MSTGSKTKLLPTDSYGFRAAADLLRAGDLVAFPTETVYGLGGDATNGKAVASIFATKGRPNFNPLIVHVPDTISAWKYVDANDAAKNLAEMFWPGALTMVLPRLDNCSVSELASAGLNTLAVRVPDHPVAQTLLREARIPVAAPSANRSGRISPTQPGHVETDLSGHIAAILDGGVCSLGLESTVVGFGVDGPVILRPGAVTAEQIDAVVRLTEHKSFTNDKKPSSPGQLSSHYAPTTRLRLEATQFEADEAVLAFGSTRHEGAILNLSERGDVVEAAANLYHMMRELDAGDYVGIAVMPIPEIGIGAAINDRLRRAAFDKDK